MVDIMNMFNEIKLVGRDFLGKASFVKALDEGRLKWYKGK